MTVKKVLLWTAGLLLAFQLVPYGRDHSNPLVTAEPAWNAPETRALFFKACRDCHSNETVWPWYSSVAPFSWLVASDVAEGRSHFNVSTWGPESEHGDDAAEELEEGEMPLWFYLPLHPEARLSDAERTALIQGLEATFGSGEAASGDGHHDHHHDHDH